MEETKVEVSFASLSQLEGKLKTLKMEWEFFFTGQRRTPPLKEQDNFDKEIKKFKNTSITDNALRFKFNSIYSNYTSIKELWAKRMRQIEEGKARTTKEKTLTQKDKPKEIVISKQSNFKEQIENLYLAISSMQDNKKTASFIEFEKKMRQQLLDLFRKTNCEILKISVVSEGGKTKIKVKPVKEKKI
ncbi:MAG: hypothetical protein WHV67_05100 [Thermoanaerobaculia bacterium]